MQQSPRAIQTESEMEDMDINRLKDILGSLEAVYEEQLDYISELDAAIGDGDHGASMVRGFAAVNTAISNSHAETIAALLEETGRVLMKEIGGTCGPLYAMLFIKGAQPLKGKEEMNAEEYGAFLTAGAQGMQQLGKAEAGDKTMLDALIPAAQAAVSAAKEGAGYAAAATAAKESARRGMEATADMVSKRGRGRYQGDGSKGHIDAGAASMAVLLSAFAG